MATETYVKPRTENFPLLKLIPEIRDQVYEFVLNSSILAPHHPFENASNKLRPVLDSTLEGCALYPTWRNLPNPSANLLATNRQVHDEVLGQISRLKRSKHFREQTSRYELDILFGDNESIYPTWLFVPMLASEAPHVLQINIRDTGNWLPSASRPGGWRGSNDCPPSILWGFFTIVKQFLLHGPALETDEYVDAITEFAKDDAGNGRMTCQGILKLDTLVINIQTPSETEMKGKYFRSQGTQSLLSQDPPGVTHPETLVRVLCRYLSDKIRGTNKALYWKMVYDRVDSIKVCYDGDQWGSLNVREMREQS